MVDYNIQMANPAQSFMQGVQMRSAIEAQNMQRQQLAQQQQLAAQQQKDLAALAANPNPTAEDYAKFSLKYPQMADNVRKSWDMMGADKQKNQISAGTQILSALRSGNTDVAVDLLNQRATAQRNSGDETAAKATEALAQTAQMNPKVASDTIALTLSAAMGPNNFSNAMGALLKTPEEAERLRQENLAAPTTQALEQQGMIEDIQSKRLKRQLDMIDSQLKQTESSAKVQELQTKREDLLKKEQDRKDAESAKQAAAQSTYIGLEGQIDVIDRLLASPVTEGGIGGVGSFSRWALALKPSSEAKDFNALLETVKSQQFLSNLAALKRSGGTLGQVTEAEGMRMEKAIASLDADQSPEAFKAAVNTIKNSLRRVQNEIVASGKLPKGATGPGSTFVTKSQKYGNVTDAMINKALEDNPGLTRAQAIKFFESN